MADTMDAAYMADIITDWQEWNVHATKWNHPENIRTLDEWIAETEQYDIEHASDYD